MKRCIAKILSLVLVLQMMGASVVSAAPVSSGTAQEPDGGAYEIPVAPNVDYNMNMDWKFSLPDGKRWPLEAATSGTLDGDGHKFYEVGFDDSAWDTVSVPHTFNEGEIFDNKANGQGDSSQTRCISFYRKHFQVAPEHNGKKMFLELEGVRQAAYVWVNGTFVGYYEAGVNPFGFDITGQIRADGTENIVALALDNTSGRGMSEYMSETRPGSAPGSSDGTSYQWNTNEFNPTIGGLTRDVILHVKNDVYQTLPLYSNLKTSGTYVYGSSIDPKNETAVLHVEAEVRNESVSGKELSLEVAVVDKDGNLWYEFGTENTTSVPVAADKGIAFQTVVPADAYESNPAPTDTSTVEVKKIEAAANVKGLHLWSTKDPFLYDVYSIVKDGDTVVDVTKITTGFRKVEAKGGVNGGIYINDELVWLTGYAQRATNEWAAVGVVPDWLHDYDMGLVRESNANFIRWMHIAAQPADIRSCDKYGIACVQPAGDKEADAKARSWDQRMETMRDVIIYFRNSPSILFWEAGNQYISADHMEEMTNMRKKLDPHGDRVMGCRGLSEMDAVEASEYVGTMLGRKVEVDGVFSGGGSNIRDMRAIVESEYYREESPRRVWDDYTPPSFDYVHNGGEDTWDLTAEQFVVKGAKAYADYYLNRVGANCERPVYSAAAALCWTDSIQHGRNLSTENARMSGRVDAVRVKKQSFYGYQVLQSRKPSVYVVGHWNYPTDIGAYPSGIDPTNKTVYVMASNCRYVELFVNGQSMGKDATSTDGFIYEFPAVDITQSGYIEAVAYDRKGEEVARHKIETTGEAAEIRLTPVTGEEGLLADGSDLAYFDLEIVDEEGRVVPLDYSEIQLELTGPATLRGGYNSGYEVDYDGTGKVNVGEMNRNPEILRAECGSNRVMIRAGRTAGTITLTAKREGLADATATIESSEIDLEGGLTEKKPQTLTPDIEVEDPEETDVSAMMLPLLDPVVADFSEGGNTEIVGEEAADKKEIKVYVGSEKVDFGVGESGAPLVAYLMADSVFAPAEPFLEALGVDYEIDDSGEDAEITINKGNLTVVMKSSDIVVMKDGSVVKEWIINQIAQEDDGVLHIEISAVVEALGLKTNGWTAGMDEYKVSK